MEEEKRYFNGKGLYRLIKDGIGSEEDMDRVAAAVQSGKHGKSTVWRTTWEEDDDGNKTPGTFKVYQRIINQMDVESSEEDETRPKRSRREQCEIDTQSHRLDDINTKLNFTIAAVTGGDLMSCQCANLDERWKCDVCGHDWFGRLTDCPKCGADREEHVWIK